MKFIQDKQHAIGYDEYIVSDFYKEICNQRSPKKVNKELCEEAKQLKDKLHLFTFQMPII
jgi:hypothetical protein